jgi:hypothetical protein
MAKKQMPRTVRVRALVSFNDVRAGDEAWLPWGERVHAWERAGLVELIDSEVKEIRRGESETGPGAVEPDTHERVAVGAEGSVPAGGEPGQDFGAGPYGSPA